MATANNLATLMAQLGYGTGFRLPVANEENQRLEKQLEEKQRIALEIRGKVENERKRRNDLHEQANRMTTQISLSQTMIRSKQATLETEKGIHIRQKHDQNHLKSEIVKVKQKYQDLHTKNKANIEQLEKRKDWCESQRVKETRYKEALDNLRHLMKNKENDMNYVLNLLNIDNKTIYDYEFKYLKLGGDLAASKQELNQAAQNTQVLHQQYGQMIALFRQSHRERNENVEMWKVVLTTLRNRDETIFNLAESYRKVDTNIQKTNQLLDKTRLIFDISQKETNRIQDRILWHDHCMGGIRLEISEGNKHIAEMSTTLRGLQNITTKSSSSTRIIYDKIQTMDREMETMDIRITAFANKVKGLKEKLKFGKGGETSDDRLKAMEDLVEEEENKIVKTRKNLEKMRNLHCGRTNEVLVVKQEIQNMEFEMKSVKYLFKNLRQVVKVNEAEERKKKYDFYSLEFQLVVLEREFNKFTSPKDIDGQLLAETRDTLDRCRQELSEIIRDKILLTNQKGHISDCTRRLRKDVADELFQKINLETLLDEWKSEATCTEKEIIISSKIFRDTQVEFSMTTLTQRRLSKMVMEQNEAKFTLEKDRLDLHTIIQQRRVEIDRHMFLLQSKLRFAKDQKSKLTFERNQILAEIVKRKSSYEIITSIMISRDERESGEFSEAQFIVKHAQEKEMVKREGDLWDSRVKEAERETTALQNTLAVMKNSNNSFKESLTPALAKTEEWDQVKALERKLTEATIRQRNANKTLRNLVKEFHDKDTEMKELNVAVETIKGVMSDKQYHLNALILEIKKQQEKIVRATKVALRIQKSFKNQSASEKKIIETELKLKFAQDKYNYALKMLDRAILTHPELKSPVLEYLNQKPCLNHIAKHLEKSGKCISVENSQPPTPKQKLSKMTFMTSVRQSSDSILTKQQPQPHRALNKLPSIFEIRKANNALGAYGPEDRRVQHDDLIAKLNEYPNQKMGMVKSAVKLSQGVQEFPNQAGNKSNKNTNGSNTSSSRSSIKSGGKTSANNGGKGQMEQRRSSTTKPTGSGSIPPVWH